MRWSHALLLLLSLLLFICPHEAYAWGPGVHAVTGNWLLGQLQLLAPPLSAVLATHGQQFLHGLQSPDIFIGKGSKAKEGHSHNWDSGLALLDKARGQAQQAFALGYLAHLAEDTVAHNVFVPSLLRTLPNIGRWAHIYLEAQADRRLAWRSSRVIGSMHAKGSRKTTRMLGTTLKQNPFAFWLKKQLFQGGVAVGGSRLWRKSMVLADKVLTSPQQMVIFDSMLRMSTAAMIDVIRHGRDARILMLDPIGADALSSAKALPRPALVDRHGTPLDLGKGIQPDWEQDSLIPVPQILWTLSEEIPEAQSVVRR